VRGLSDPRVEAAGVGPELAAALAAIDEANAEDPTEVLIGGVGTPLALAHGRLASAWVRHLRTDAADVVLLAARAHHLRRWEVPRTSYPEGRVGYLRWRRDQKARHADEVATILVGAGYPDVDVARVQALIRREHLGRDPDVQLVEDAACLVFMETQLGSLAARLERTHLLEVIRKTAAKMSPEAIAATALLPLGAAERDLLSAALG
jgi:hypothetical protein